MRVKTAARSSRSQPPVVGRAMIPQGVAAKVQGARLLLLVLFVVAILVTAVAALMLGHKIGYQRGYHLQQTQAEQDVITGDQATTELKSLRLSSKVLINQAETAKQELSIVLTNMDELRQTQNALTLENKQVMQLNNLYAKVIVDKGGMPLQVLGAKIEPLPENAFEYGFDVGMLSQDGQAKTLTASLTLQDKDSFVEIPLSPSQFSIEGIVRIRGRFLMPEGFRPLQVKLNLTTGNQQIEQLYDWKIGGMINTMSSSLFDLPKIDGSPIVD